MMLSKCLDYDPEALEVALVHSIVFWAACHQLHGKGTNTTQWFSLKEIFALETFSVQYLSINNIALLFECVCTLCALCKIFIERSGLLM